MDLSCRPVYDCVGPRQTRRGYSGPCAARQRLSVADSFAQGADEARGRRSIVSPRPECVVPLLVGQATEQPSGPHHVVRADVIAHVLFVVARVRKLHVVAVDAEDEWGVREGLWITLVRTEPPCVAERGA